MTKFSKFDYCFFRIKNFKLIVIYLFDTAKNIIYFIKKTANKTSLRDTINMLAERTSIVACYNYTGTPYVNKQVLPEVVYAYGLRESIWNGYLKDADPIAFENVKDTEFLRMAVTTFWERYGGKTYEGLNPKLAIYASRVEEAVNEVRPALEEILADLGIPASSILVNVGETKYTKDEDIRNFNDLDVQGSQGNEKQFIILVDKGKEGWNCRSLFGVAMFRNPNSKIFVLQATMRCLRTITDDRLTATVFLSKENYDTLDDELHKNFNMDIKNMKTNRLQRASMQTHTASTLNQRRNASCSTSRTAKSKRYTLPECSQQTKEICLFNTMTLNLAVSGITTLTSWPSSKMVPIS